MCFKKLSRNPARIESHISISFSYNERNPLRADELDDEEQVGLGTPLNIQVEIYGFIKKGTIP